MEAHPLSKAWPDLPADEFEELVEDIRVNGVRKPIILYEDMILDGRHRYEASLKAGRDCPVEKYEGTDPVGVVKSENAHRRHISKLDRTKAVRANLEWERSQKIAAAQENGESQRVPPVTHSEVRDAARTSTATARRALDELKRDRGELPPAPPPAPRPKPVVPVAPASTPAPVVAGAPVVAQPKQPLYNAVAPSGMNLDGISQETAATRIRDLERDLEEVSRERDYYKSQASAEAHERYQIFQNQDAEIASLRSQLSEYQTKYQDLNQAYIQYRKNNGVAVG